MEAARGQGSGVSRRPRDTRRALRMRTCIYIRMCEHAYACVNAHNAREGVRRGSKWEEAKRGAEERREGTVEAARGQGREVGRFVA